MVLVSLHGDLSPFNVSVQYNVGLFPDIILLTLKVDAQKA